MPLRTTQIHEWRRPGYLISTDLALVDREAVNAAFASDALSWAQPLSEEELQVMLERSACFCVFVDPDTASDSASKPDLTTTNLLASQREMIGLARICTDYVTMAYLTDVYISPAYQSRGLGLWLLDCVKQWWDMMPMGRRIFLVAQEGRAEQFYARQLGMGRMEDEIDARTGEKIKYRVFTAGGRGKII